MAKKAYIGVDGVARKVKKGYVGVLTDIPIYSEETQTAAITDSNISEFFDVTNGSSYYFAGSGDTFTSNNNGVNSSTATTVLTAKQDISALSFNYSYSSEANYDKFTLKVAGTTVENAVSGATTSKSYSGSLTAGQTIEFTYAKDSSQSKNDDKCTFYAMVVTATVQVQVGTETNSLARKIKKAYIGIGGVARPCWSGGELAYYGTITPLPETRTCMASARASNYAIFSGGRNPTALSRKTAYAYDENLTLSVLTEMTYGRYMHGGASLNGCAVFAGGDSTSNDGCKAGAVYDQDLTMTSYSFATAFHFETAMTAISDFAMFYGGHDGTKTDCNSNFYAIDKAFTVQSKSLGTAKSEHAATRVGEIAIFAGGYDGNAAKSSVNAIDSTLTEISGVSFLYESRYYLSANTINNKLAFFAGGYNPNGGASAEVEVFDQDLTKTIVESLSVGRSRLASAAIGNVILFFGGYTTTVVDVVDQYDEDMTRTTAQSLSQARCGLSAEITGNFAIVAGGRSSSSESNTAYDTTEAYIFS